MNSANWWAQKLGNGMPPVPARPADMPMPPSQQPMTRFTPPQPQAAPQKAVSASQTDLCPTCGSSNYLSVNKAQKRCFDCGYPLEQAGSRYGSLTGANVEGPTKGSIGNNPMSNWNPQGIIGRVQ